MSVENWIGVASLLANIALFIIGTLVLPSIKATKDGISKVADELQKMQLELVSVKTQMTGVEALRQNIHNLRNDVQQIQLRLAANGLWKTTTDIQHES